MSRITWDAVGSRKYEVGVDHGVLYLQIGDEFTDGVAWNGLTGVDSEDDGGGSTPLYSGDVKVDNVSTYDEYSGTITAYTYPIEFEACMGAVEPIPGIYTKQQAKSRFGLSYRTLIGNDVKGSEYGYRIHLIYNAGITSVSRSSTTVNDSGEGEELSWDFDTLPQLHDDFDPYSEIIIDSTKFKPEHMEELQNILYGTENNPPRMPDLEELIDLFYEEPPAPSSWEGYPYSTLYPSTEIFPIDPNNLVKIMNGRLYFISPGEYNEEDE